MTDAAWALLAGAAICGIFDWAAVGAANKSVEYVAKPVTMAFLIAAALALDPADDLQRVLFVTALAFSAAGDVFLMLEERFFVPGLASFLVAHLLYVAGFLAAGVDTNRMLLWIGGLILVGAWPAWLVTRGATRKDARLRFPVIAYVGVISAMVAFAGGSGVALAIAGAILFYLSDTLIGISRFVRDFPRARLAIIVTYHLGQAGLVLSLAR